MREWIGAQLEVYDQRARQRLARRARTGGVNAFDVRWRSVAGGHPQAPAFPAGIRIIDAAVHAFGKEAHGVGDAQFNDPPVRHCVQ